MIVALTPHPDQIRHYVELALNGFETLEAKDAIENAKADLRSLLAYLNGLRVTDYAVPVFGIETIKSEPQTGFFLSASPCLVP